MAIEARHEEAPRLQEQAGEPLRPTPLRLEHREGAQAGAHSHRPTGHGDLAAHRWDDPATERATVDRRGRIPLVAVAGRQQRYAKRGERAAFDHRGGVAGQARERVVFRSVVGEEQRHRALSRGPHGDRDLPAKHRYADLVDGAFRVWLPQPGRRPVARRQRDRLFPERARGPLRVAGVADNPGVAIVLRELELVLQAGEPGWRQMQDPAAVLTDEP